MNTWKYALLTLVAACHIGAASAEMVEMDKVAIIVNTGVILDSDIDNAVKTLKFNAKESKQALPSQDVLIEQVKEKLILETLQQQEAQRIGVRIDDNRLNDAIANIAKQNNQTVEQLIATIKDQGISYEKFREQIHNEMLASEARNALVRRRINILPAEVENLSEVLAQETNATVQYKIGHIQLRVEDGDDKSQVQAQANELIEKLKNGEDFAKLAYTYSKGPKALQGGDWGWMRKEEMPTIFADQIKLQNKGSVIGPFLSGVGFHILKIEDVKGLETVAVTEINARHILIKPTIILSDDGAQKQLNEFIRQINAGEATFAELAKQYSQDPGSAAKNGELGYQTSDLYVPEFKHQVDTIAISKISAPFKTVHGWHIVEVLDRREVDRTDSAMKDKAYRILFNRKFNEEAGAWVQELRAGAYVEMVKDERNAN